MSFNFREHPDFDNHMYVVYFNDPETEARGFIAIHNNWIGPGLGGMRWHMYGSEQDALKDVLRLSKGMTNKAAIAGVPFGGAKMVVIGDPKNKTEKMLRACGRRVDMLGGAYITAEDVGTSVADIETIGQETIYVTGKAQTDGGGGDPSPITAQGVVYGQQAALEVVYGSKSFAGRSVAIQGLGKVGFRLGRFLHEQRAQLFIADVDKNMIERAKSEFPDAVVVPTGEIHAQKVDIFAPCAMGAAINDATIAQLCCRIVAGAANNQLDRPEHGDKLHEMGILYAPDYMINAGGLMNVADEQCPGGYHAERVLKNLRKIYFKLARIFKNSKGLDIPSHRLADLAAQEILESARAFNRKSRFIDLDVFKY